MTPRISDPSHPSAAPDRPQRPQNSEEFEQQERAGLVRRPGPDRTRRRCVRTLGPNWYAAVMGTAILASGGAALPVQLPSLLPVFRAVWAVSAALLAAVLVGRCVHWRRHTDQARADLRDPAVAPFYGCLSMAVLAVGGAALSVRAPAAVAIDSVLWTVGTLIGLLAAAGVPYLMVVRHTITDGQASPVWLLPVVAPMVSAALGPPLAARLAPGQGRSAMVLGCYALFGISLLLTLVILPTVFSRLIHHGALPSAATPALFLVLGPLGQSTTAMGNLADASPGTFATAAVLYGVPVLGFALLWLGLSTALVVRALRGGMRFSMTWWAFTFPVGTCVTGAAALARHTQLQALVWLSVGLYVLLLAGWTAAATGTVRGLVSAELLAAHRPATAEPLPTTARTT